MSQIKVCPHCGSKMFVGAITRGCAIESVIDESGNPSFKLVKESSGNKYDLEILKCCRCKKDVKADELVEGVSCKECGRIVNPDELNEDGLCEVCAAVKQRAELANASREDLIQMLLNAEKQANPVTTKGEKQGKKAEKIEEKKDDTDADETKEKKPATKKGGRRGKVKVGEDTKLDDDRKNETDDTTDENEKSVSEEKEEHVTDVEAAKAVDDIANQQDAPFPDLNENGNSAEDVASLPMNPPEPEQAAPASQGTEDFKMFDDRDDEPF